MADLAASFTVADLTAIAIAIATVVLGWATKVLADETRRMARAASQPHIVATLEVNMWSMSHLDVKVENTGNATAYDIVVGFDPPLVSGQGRENHQIPLRTVRETLIYPSPRHQPAATVR